MTPLPLRARRRHGGFTYFGILLVIAFMGIGLALMGTMWGTEARRNDERELLRVGHAYQRAVASYYAAMPRGVHEYPLSLDALVEDRRGPVLLRHLRQLYPDPVTGANDWQIISLTGGAIVGVASASQAVPLKQANFPPWAVSLEGQSCLCDWQFVHLPQLASGPVVSP